MRPYSFEKLEVYQLSLDLANTIYTITKTYPKVEWYGLAQHTRKTVISVPSNISEGSGRQSFKEQARFTEIAYSSLMELLTQITIALDLQFITEEDYVHLRMQIEKLSNKLNSFHKAQLNRA